MRRCPGQLRDDGLTLLGEDLLLCLGKALLHLHLLTKVGEDADRPDRGRTLIEEGRRQRNRYAPTTPLEDLRAQPLHTALPDLNEAHDVVSNALRIKRADVAADDLRHGDPVDAFSRGVGQENAPRHIGAHDGVDGRIDDALQKVLGLVQLVLDFALRRDVTERTEDDPSSRSTELKLTLRTAISPLFLLIRTSTFCG